VCLIDEILFLIFRNISDVNL